MSRFDRSFSAAQARFDAMEPPGCDDADECGVLGDCDGTERVSCPDCGGIGRHLRGYQPARCETCHGRRTVRCDGCAGCDGECMPDVGEESER